MLISKRKYYCRFLLTMMVTSVLIIIGALIANKYMLHFSIIDRICRYILLSEIAITIFITMCAVIRRKGFKNIINYYRLLFYIEDNLLSVGTYTKKDNKAYVELPKIKIKNNQIRISLKNIKIRAIIERYLDSFSTALPNRFIVDDYYITQNNAEVIMHYEDIKNYKLEEYTISQYINKVKSIDKWSLYFDKKHIVNINDYPHFLISGSSGSGKSYFMNLLVIQAIVKGWEVVILDLKRSYGLYKGFTDYCVEIDDIIDKLHYIESEMASRMQKLESELDKNPRALAIDIGYKPMIVVLEEYISLQASLDKKKKEELERIVKNISVLARQSNIHLMIVLQSAGTDNIQSSTRNNLTKVLLGNAQSNILNATFGNGVDIPNIRSKLKKGEGLIQLDRITMLRIPRVENIDEFKDIIG